MNLSMLGWTKDHEVLNAIIKFVPINMMNLFQSFKRSTNALFHNPSVFSDSFFPILIFL